jgi:hypothetical protein
MSRSPAEKLNPRIALLSGAPSRVRIEIVLEPFLLSRALVNTSLTLDDVPLPSLYLKDLVGQTFRFPTNPEEGFIDSSVCIESVHHPVDVTELAFHASRGNGASLVLKGAINFDFEGPAEWGKFPFVFGMRAATLVV